MFSPQQIGTRPNTREHAVLEKLWEARPHTSLLETQTDTSSIWTELAAAISLQMYLPVMVHLHLRVSFTCRPAHGWHMDENT